MEAGTISNHVILGQPFHFSEAYFHYKRCEELKKKNSGTRVTESFQCPLTQE